MLIPTLLQPHILEKSNQGLWSLGIQTVFLRTVFWDNLQAPGLGVPPGTDSAVVG